MLPIRLRLDRRLLDRHPNDDAPSGARRNKGHGHGEDVAGACAREAARNSAADGLAKGDLARDRFHLGDLFLSLIVWRRGGLGRGRKGICGSGVLLCLVERASGGGIDDERVLARTRGEAARVIKRA